MEVRNQLPACLLVTLLPWPMLACSCAPGSLGFCQALPDTSSLNRAVFIGKYEGFAAGLKVRIGAVFSALFGFRLGELKYLLAGQKIDGTQE